MLPDEFFKEYANTGATPAHATDAPVEMEKEYYTRAEVDQMLSERLSEAISKIRDEQVKVKPMEDDSQVETTTQEDDGTDVS